MNSTLASSPSPGTATKEQGGLIGVGSHGT